MIWNSTQLIELNNMNYNKYLSHFLFGKSLCQEWFVITNSFWNQKLDNTSLNFGPLNLGKL
jgi:hypothetical protein